MSRVNVGYDIIAFYNIGKNEEIVLGFNKDAMQSYVIWTCLDSNNYINGRYFENSKDAIKNYNSEIRSHQRAKFKDKTKVIENTFSKKGGRHMC